MDKEQAEILIKAIKDVVFWIAYGAFGVWLLAVVTMCSR